MTESASSRSLQQLSAKRDTQLQLFKDIQAQQQQYETSRDVGSLSTLQESYQRAYIQAIDESRMIAECLSQVKTLLRRRDRKSRVGRTERSTTNLPSIDMDEEMHVPAAATGSVPSVPSSFAHPMDDMSGDGNIWRHDHTNILPTGSQVAALIDEHSIPPLWILCSVKGYRPGARPKYEVVDLDQGEAPVDSSAPPIPQKRYVLDARKILPLPSLQQVPMHLRREFQKGERVRAVFPTSGITTLYPAEVVVGARKRKNHTYLLKFDDDEDVNRSVSAHLVVPLLEHMSDDS